jgi:ornithine--oxo-acid transaminase
MTDTIIEHEARFCAQNYAPLPVVLVRGEGCHLWDGEGRRYVDMMSAYSAVSHGHCHPRLVKVLTEQARRLAIVSRAFHTDKLAPFLERACELTGMDRALPVNSGAEAVETAIKAARKWAYEVKCVEPETAEIIACDGNFHGRTLGALSLSTEEQYLEGFGPFAPGVRIVPFGDAGAMERAITPSTAAFIVEPIQGEAGVRIPPAGYLRDCAEICRKHNVLLIADEIQTGLGRTGRILACDHEGVKPDAVTLGKSLGGGLLPVSMFLARKEVMSVFRPGDHGSTFGGNALASAVGLEALNTLVDENLCERSAELGAYMLGKLQQFHSPLVRDIRGRGLWIGIEFYQEKISARRIAEALLKRGILSKDTHGTIIRLAPPLVITRDEVDWVLRELRAVISDAERSIADARSLDRQEFDVEQ